MLSAALFIARKDIAFLIRKRETILWTFVMPIVFFYFIGTVTGGFAGPADRQDTLALRGGTNGGFLVDELIARLTAQRYDVVRPADDQAFAAHARRLTIPAP